MVADGSTQKEGIDYDETYALVAKMKSIRLLLNLAAAENLLVHQIDIETAYLNSDIDKDIYMKQPPGYAKPGTEHLYCKLLKGLYGLKQGGKLWYDAIRAHLLSLGFKPLQSDPCIYVRQEAKGEKTYIALYVDDLLIAGTSKWVANAKAMIANKFKIVDLGVAKYCLGIEITHTDKEIQISQEGYIKQCLVDLGMADAIPLQCP